MQSTRYTDAYLSGQSHTLAAGRKDLGAAAVGAIYAPGGNGADTSWQTAGTATNPQETYSLIANVCDRANWQPGYRIASFATEWTWGNDSSVNRIQQLYTYAQSNHGFSGTKVHLVGVSMGATCVLNWALVHPTKVASLSLILPCVDIQDIEDNARATEWGIPQPSTAYGDVRPPDDHNPADNAASYASMPVRIWYSTNDEISMPATITAFAAGSGADLISMGDQPPHLGIPGHSLDSGFTARTVREFMDLHP